MNPQHPQPARRHGMRRAVVALPNGFTLFNLFCGIYAIVLSSRGGDVNLKKATFYIVLGGIADVLDGRVARATGTGSKFGQELDSLVDAISFGLAPAMMMYFAVLRHEGWDWIFVFIFAAFAVMRLARFNVEQAGRAKTHFHGLPSPAAGMTLASYYWFSQTPFYNNTVILLTDAKTLAELPWTLIMRYLMLVLAFLMMSDVPYPAVPSIGFRSFRQWIGSIVVIGSILAIASPYREQFIFPMLLAYVVFGLARAIWVGFTAKRRVSPESIYWDEDEPNGDEDPPRRSEVHRGPTGPVSPSGDAERTRAPRPPSTPAEEDERARRRKRRRRGRGQSAGGPTQGSPSTKSSPPPPPPPPTRPESP